MDAVIEVAIVTYNQKDYIRQALDSVLAQELNEKFQIIIYDDCSNDYSKTIYEEYMERYPDVVTVKYSSHNLGITKNYERVFSETTAKYVAILEGDDYWCSNNKLKMIIDIFNGNEKVSIVANRFDYFLESTQTLGQCETIIPRGKNKILTIYDLAKNNFIINFSSCAYRTKCIKQINPKAFENGAYDWLINLECAQLGDIYYIDKVMSIYRIHNQSNWSSISKKEQLKMLLETIKLYDLYFDGKYSSVFAEHRLEVENLLKLEAAPITKKEIIYKDILKKYLPFTLYRCLRKWYLKILR